MSKNLLTHIFIKNGKTFLISLAIAGLSFMGAMAQTPPVTIVPTNATYCDGASVNIDFVALNSAAGNDTQDVTYHWERISGYYLGLSATSSNGALNIAVASGGVTPLIRHWKGISGFYFGLSETSGINEINFTATNIGITPLTALFKVTPCHNSGEVSTCGEPQNFIITVNPIPEPAPVANITICNDEKVYPYLFTGNIRNATLSWTMTPEIPNMPTSGYKYLPAFKITNKSNAAKVYTCELTASYSYSNKTCSSAPTSFTITVDPKMVCNPDTCEPEFVDPINGITYNVVPLVGLCWFQENLYNTLYADGTEIPFARPYKDLPKNEEDFGLLYTYESLTSYPSPHTSICPDGWRLPTTDEWALLDMYDATELNNHDYWLQPNSYLNSVDFDVRGAGFFNSVTGRFENLYRGTAFWSSDAMNHLSTSVMFNFNCDQIQIFEITKEDALSVRCVMENE